MCEPRTSLSSGQAALQLARLMERQLGYDEGHIDPVALRMFIQLHWSKVSVFAHAIHEGREKEAVTGDSARQIGDHA